MCILNGNIEDEMTQYVKECFPLTLMCLTNVITVLVQKPVGEKKPEVTGNGGGQQSQPDSDTDLALAPEPTLAALLRTDYFYVSLQRS